MQVIYSANRIETCVCVCVCVCVYIYICSNMGMVSGCCFN